MPPQPQQQPPDKQPSPNSFRFGRASIGRRFAMLCTIPLVAVTIGAALYLDYRDTREATSAQEQKAATHASLLGLNAALFILTDYDERFREELKAVSEQQTDFVACRVTGADGSMLLEWDAREAGPGEADVVVAVHPLSFDGEKLGSIEITLDMARIHAVLASNRRYVVVADVLILAVVVLLCMAEGRRLTRSIGTLAKSVEGIAGGNFDQRASEGADEIGRLGTAFNHMAQALDESMREREQARAQAIRATERLQVAYTHLQDDIEQRERLEAELAQAQKLEAIGHLAAGIAHEINTPTQYVGDNVRFLEDSLGDVMGIIAEYGRLVDGIEGGVVPPDSVAAVTKLAEECDLAFLLEEIPLAIAQSTDGVAQVASIVKAMKEFSHMGDSDEMFEADLNAAIGSTIVVARGAWKTVAEVETDLDPGLPLVPCRAGVIKQVFLNILVNAAHAIGDSESDGALGLIRVVTCVAIDTEDTPDMVEIRISDSGSGIPEHVRDKIFDPFFTTKEVGRGTGQGLAIAYDCVTNKHGGTLTFETELGIGTTFVIRLPLHQSGAAALAAEA